MNSVRVDIPNYVVPNVLLGQITTRQTSPGVPRVQMPVFNTIVTPVETPVQRPGLVAPGEITSSAQGARENLVAVLSEIDRALLIPTRAGKNKRGYTRPQLMDFARRLGISVSGDRKQQIINEIIKLLDDMGM